jgi:hypothetical protein
LRLHSARLAGAFLGCSLGRERLREIVGARMVGQLPGMRGRCIKMKHSQFARIVKRVDLRYSGGNSAWVRDPTADKCVFRFALKFCVINDEGRRAGWMMDDGS